MERSTACARRAGAAAARGPRRRGLIRSGRMAEPTHAATGPAPLSGGEGRAGVWTGATVRRLLPSDAIPAITGLLHRAYARQVAMGLRPLAGRQDDAVTARRVQSGECWVAVDQAGAIVGVIILSEREPDEGPPFFHRAGVVSFSQFAVEPSAQRGGIGRELLGRVAARARELGNSELALSMAEPDTQLRDYYLAKGFRIVGTWKWPYTNYTSLIMSRALRESAGDPGPASGGA
ncbi:MAG: GNAT family N-acetyltransferase [Planctomyces sp.]|nr:GNAT family N-acetyltransferase [Planctomyces sp.]